MNKLNQKLCTFMYGKGVSVLLVFTALFFASCNNAADDANKLKKTLNELKTEEFVVNFGIEGSGGNLTAKIDGGKDIKKGDKVEKEKTVIFTAVPDNDKKIDCWTLDGKVVNGEETEYRLKITKEVNVVVKFKDSATAKKIQIKEILLGYPNISDKDGKTIAGSVLNSNTTIPDFDVPDSKFPVMIFHNEEFTLEQVFITFDGGDRNEIKAGILTKDLITKDYTLTENKKTPFVIEITADNFEPIKLSFNVTYKKPLFKSFDDDAHIKFTLNKNGSKSKTYGMIGDEPLSVLIDGSEVLTVSTETPKLFVEIVQSEGQPKAEIKLNNVSVSGDFSAGSNTLKMDLPALSKGENSFEIQLSKPGYETKTYKLKLDYQPLLTLKKLTVNGVEAVLPVSSPIILESSDPNPVTITAEANEADTEVSFKKMSGIKWIDVTSPVSINEGETLKMRVYLKRDGYTTTFISFDVKRKEKINVTKITVDGVIVTSGLSHNVEKTDAKADIAVHLGKSYKGITFKINNEVKTPDMNGDNTVATFKDFPLNANASKTVVMRAEAEGFTFAERTITVSHTSPSTQNAIAFTKILVDGTIVAAGETHSIEKNSASAKIEVYLKQSYSGIGFTINDVPRTPEMDTSNTIATFNDFPLTANTSNTIKIKAQAAGFTEIEQTITITHTTPASSDPAYITEAAITPWDYEDSGFFWPEKLTKDGADWKGSLSDGGPHQFSIKVNPNGKDISDITKFKLYMKNKTHNQIYADTKTGKNDSGNVLFEFYRDMTANEIKIPAGMNELEVKIYYEDTVVESCIFFVKR